MDAERPTSVLPRRAWERSNVPALLTLVASYWEFEGITGFDQTRVATQLTRLLSTPELR